MHANAQDKGGRSSTIWRLDLHSEPWVTSWKVSNPGGVCHGLAVLPTQGVVIAGSFTEGRLHVLRLSDGINLGSVRAPFVTQVATNPSDGTVFAVTSESHTTISVFKWKSDCVRAIDEASTFNNLVAQKSLGGSNHRAGATFNKPIVVVPAAAGRRIAHLVVAIAGNAEIEIFELPSGRRVHRMALVHQYSRMRIVGLSAAPSGTALAVSDFESGAVHVLSWPLPGMPMLE